MGIGDKIELGWALIYCPKKELMLISLFAAKLLITSQVIRRKQIPFILFILNYLFSD